MKKLITAFCMLLSVTAFSQKMYSKSKASKVDKERLNSAKTFAGS
ncbi:hypothetical protein [Chryseobacterium caseinilyticum]|nr:hypothetical protein [Chryseobacterium caseinilyticum]